MSRANEKCSIFGMVHIMDVQPTEQHLFKTMPCWTGAVLKVKVGPACYKQGVLNKVSSECKLHRFQTDVSVNFIFDWLLQQIQPRSWCASGSHTCCEACWWKCHALGFIAMSTDGELENYRHHIKLLEESLKACLKFEIETIVELSTMVMVLGMLDHPKVGTGELKPTKMKTFITEEWSKVSAGQC